MIELTVTVKGEDSTYKQKFLIYDIVEMHEHDPVIKSCIDQALENAKIQPDDIRVRALLTVK